MSLNSDPQNPQTRHPRANSTVRQESSSPIDEPSSHGTLLYVSATIVARANSHSNVGSTSRREHRHASARRRATSGTIQVAYLARNKEGAFQRLYECALDIRTNWHGCWDFRLACGSSLRSQFFGYNSAGSPDNFFHRQTVAKCRACVWRTYEANFGQCG